MKTVPGDKVRMGVVGCGFVADYGHIPAIDRSERAELVGFVDPDETRRRAQMDKYGKPGFATFEQMVEAVELDAVSICTHPDLKLEQIRIAAAHGLHAFCEKPLTDTIEQAEQLVERMDEAELFVGVAFIFRGMRAVQRMAELIREGAIGTLKAVHLENMWDYHGLRGLDHEAVKGARRRRALENLGTLDCGVHKLDLARYLSGGDFTRIAAIGEIVEPENRYPDHIIAHARMSNGVLVSMEESAVWGHTAAERPRYKQGFALVGDRGVISCEQDFGGRDSHVIRVVSGERQWEEPTDLGKAWDATYDQFFRLVLGQPVEHRFIADAHDALANMRAAREIIDQCLAERSADAAVTAK